ncbi:MAG: DUF4835 family protein [Candidatus Marinimicrobia bacterium]|nr:DUF4835 family protein [Candidatus Neomarinimicrobiota bacterium]
MKVKYITQILLITFLFSGLSFAQFGNVDVTYDDRLLRDGDRQELLSLKDEIKRFFQNTEWDEEYNDLEIPLHIQIIFEGTSSKGSEQIYLSQALFSNGVDQRYFDKSFQFTYNESGSLYYDAVLFNPLSSFLAYYANLILAGEADTYEQKGGNKFYEIARAIALRGAASDYSSGWSERIRIENLLSSNHGLRKVRLATYYGIELFEYGKLESATKQFINMIAGLDEVYKQNSRDHYTMLFMNGHAERLTEILSILRQDSILNDLMELDPDNREIYERGLSVSSE